MTQSLPPLDRRRVLTIAVLPTLITSANLLAGVLAISYLADAANFSGQMTQALAQGLNEVALKHELARDALVINAAALVFFGMFCDALDGRVARMTNTTSSFGAQLDSLADVVTFGVAPALIARVSLGFGFQAVPGKILVALAVVYLIGAALRLARYNVESARMSADDDEGAGHVTKVFRGLPSPAAAGVIAALVLLQHAYDLRWMEWLLLFATPALGLLMISRLPYAHLMNRYVDGRRPMFGVGASITVVFFGVMFFAATMATAFFSYALSGPIAVGLNKVFGWPRGVWQEQDDEEALNYPLRPLAERPPTADPDATETPSPMREAGPERQ